MIYNYKKIFYCSVFLIYLIIANIYYWRTDFVDQQPFLRELPSECGVVEENFTDLTNIKHGTKTEYYLKVNYGKFSKIEQVSGLTYHQYYKIGTRVCFKRHEALPLWYAFTAIVDVLVIIIGFCYYSWHKLD